MQLALAIFSVVGLVAGFVQQRAAVKTSFNFAVNIELTTPIPWSKEQGECVYIPFISNDYKMAVSIFFSIIPV